MKLKAQYYQQFDADVTLDVPGEGYGGWGEAEIELSPEHTAVVVMHAWDSGTPEQYPGWHRCVEYFPRAQAILENVFPALLAAVRESRLPLIHVVGGGDYYKDYPGYKKTLEITPPSQPNECVVSDPAMDRLRDFRAEHVFVGRRNEQDVSRGFANVDFPVQARPIGDEPIAENSEQLLALCRTMGINHLIYTGFAIDWCLLMSPGGMLDMSRHGVMCSAVRQAVTAVENKESARSQSHKETGLWRVALMFGFVFDADELLGCMSGLRD